MMKYSDLSGGGSSPSKQRDLKIDLVKGIGIILMVYRHTEAPGSEFVLLFHMALFFMASGFLYKSDAVYDFKSLCRYIVRKIKGLWLPYFIVQCVYTLCNNLFLRLNIITDNPEFLVNYSGRYANLYHSYGLVDVVKAVIKGALFRGNAPMAGAMWFFYALFLVSVGYACIDFFIKRFTSNESSRRIIQGLIAVVFLIFGYMLSLNEVTLWGLNRFFTCYILFYFGQIFKNYGHLLYRRIHIALIFVVSMIILLTANQFGTINLSGNQIENPLYFVIVSAFGWFAVYSLAVFMEKMQFKANKFIAYISINSVPIIAMHFLCFKIVSQIGVIIYNYPGYMLAAYPVLMHGAWWIAYVAVGILCPLAVYNIFLFLFQIVHKGRSKVHGEN